MSNQYTYLFIRQDLSVPQQIIQTAHATDEINKKIELNDDTNYMVLFSVQSERDLLSASEWLSFHEIRHSMFYESDIQAYTSIATEPLKGSRRKAMSRFKMMEDGGAGHQTTSKVVPPKG